MSQLAVSLIVVGAVLLGGIWVSWMGWVSVTLIRILQGITRNDEAIDDHERRLDAAGL